MLGSPPRAREPLRVLWIAGALTLSAFLGGALGLLWHAAAGDNDGDNGEAAVSDGGNSE